ncbi:MAG: hypothetical protein CL827_00625 [Crocinitomicaceae bacterium]|nr:hypothetical protein [Crocinitomicaceae bacterium]
MFLEINLYPKKILKNVKMLNPPSIGIHGGGQQGVPPGFPGCEKYSWAIKINRIIKILFFIEYQKYGFI